MSSSSTGRRVDAAPWKSWSLDPDFYADLNDWNKRHPDTKLDRLLAIITSHIDTFKPFLDLIPDAPIPVRSLVKSITYLIQLSAVVSKAKEDIRTLAMDVVTWVSEMSSAFESGTPGHFTSKTWDDMAVLRDLIAEMCKWAAKKIRGGRLRRWLGTFSVKGDIQEFRQRWNEMSARLVNVSIVRSAQAHDMIVREVQGIPASPVFERMQTDLSLIRSGVTSGLTAVTNETLLVSAEIPRVPAIFYGRETIVEEIVDNLLPQPSPGEHLHVPVLGSGGTGKTSIALAASHHPRIVEAYGDHRYWVPCDHVPALPLLLDYLLKMFSVTKRSGDPVKDIVSHLRSVSCPRLVVVDNFETFCDPSETRTASEEILEHLSSVHQLTILLTMRGSITPGRVRWAVSLSQAITPGLPLDAARMTYKAISSHHDDHLDELLLALDCIPLAVNLVARISQTGVLPLELLECFRRTGTSLFEIAPDRHNSVNVSIRLSLESRRVSSNPDAIELLSLLSLLPGGMRQESLSLVMHEDLHASNAPMVLLGTALAYRTTDGTLQVLSPIRSYVLKFHTPHLSPASVERVRSFYFHLVETVQHDPGTENSPSARLLPAEESNLRSVIVHALKEKEPPIAAIQASIQYTNYQFWNTPNADVAQTLVDLLRTRASTEIRSQLPLALLKLGKLQFRMDNFSGAEKALEESEKAYGECGDLNGTAECQINLAHQYRLLGETEKALDKLEKAQGSYEALGNRRGAAKCRRSRGLVYSSRSRNEEASAVLNEAKRIYESVNDRAGITDCLFDMGRIYRYDKPEEALRMLTEAREYYLQFGPEWYADLCLYHIAIVYARLERYDEADATFVDVYDRFEKVGNRSQMGYTLLHQADAERLQGHLVKALELLRGAQKIWEEISNWQELGVSLRVQIRIHAALGDVEDVDRLGKDGLEVLRKIVGNVDRIAAEEEIRQAKEEALEVSEKKKLKSDSTHPAL